MTKVVHKSGKVRPANADDIAHISDLIARVWADTQTDMKLLAGEKRFSAEELPSFMDDHENVTLVHFNEASILTGVVFLTRAAPTIFELGIVAEPQKQGTGTTLLDEAIYLCRNDGITTEVYLDVFERNPAVHLYERKDFKEYDRLKSTNQRGEELTLLRLRLFIRKFSSDVVVPAQLERLSIRTRLVSELKKIISVIRKLAAID